MLIKVYSNLIESIEERGEKGHTHKMSERWTKWSQLDLYNGLYFVFIFSDEKETELTANVEDDSSSASEDTEGPEEGFDNDEDTVSKVSFTREQF